MDEPSCGCHRGPNVEHGKWYGVRSYLHLFYEDCSGASLDDDLKEPAADPSSHGWTSVVCKVIFAAGTLLLLIGAASLTTGYLLPGKLERIGEAEFMVLDGDAVEYNHALGVCRAVGLVLCAIAVALLVTCLLSSRLSKMGQGGQPQEEEGDAEASLSPILPQEMPSRYWGTVLAGPPVPIQAPSVQHIQPNGEP